MVQGTAKITGAFPLIVVALGPVTVSAGIDLGAVGSASGPGASAANTGGQPGQSVLLTERASSGGGGAGVAGHRGAMASAIASRRRRGISLSARMKPASTKHTAFGAMIGHSRRNTP